MKKKMSKKMMKERVKDFMIDFKSVMKDEGKEAITAWAVGSSLLSIARILKK